MATVLSVPVRTQAVAAVRRLSARASFVLLASIVVSFLAGSSAPTPLYAIYQAEWGFSPVAITLIFGVYALAVLVSLLTVGSLSDYVGRRPVLLVALAMQVVAMVIFTTAGSVNALLIGRVVQGLSAGGAIGALGAGMIDLDRTRGTLANSIAPMLGTATGGVVSGLMVQFLPAPTHLVYLMLLGVFVVQSMGVLVMAETGSPREGAIASLVPHFHFPAAIAGLMLRATPLLVATWSLIGFYGALGPSLLRNLIGSRSVLLGGLALFTLAGSGALTVFLMRARSAQAMMLSGAASILLGVTVTTAAIATKQTALFFLGTAIAGAGFGVGFQGAIRSVIPLAEPHQRAGVLSVLFLISYLAMGLPAIAAGLRIVHGGGLARTAYEYGAAVIALTLVALWGAKVRTTHAVST